MSKDSTSESEWIDTIATSAYADIYVTASVLLEYLFRPHFIYFMNCLCTDQNEEKRFKVLKGRERFTKGKRG